VSAGAPVALRLFLAFGCRGGGAGAAAEPRPAAQRAAGRVSRESTRTAASTRSRLGESGLDPPSLALPDAGDGGVLGMRVLAKDVDARAIAHDVRTHRLRAGRHPEETGRAHVHGL